MVCLFILLLAFKGFTAPPPALQWDASVGEVHGYIVEWMLTTETNWNTKDVGVVTSVPDIAQVFALYPGKSYTFRVYAYNVTGRSDASNTVEYTAPEWQKPVDTVIEKIIEVPGTPSTLILNLNFNTPSQ